MTEHQIAEAVTGRLAAADAVAVRTSPPRRRRRDPMALGLLTLIVVVFVMAVGLNQLQGAVGRGNDARNSQASVAASAAASASARLDTLLARIDMLQRQGQKGSALIGALYEQVAVLRAQIEASGGTPNVPANSPTPAPTRTVTSPGPTTTTTATATVTTTATATRTCRLLCR